jgi:uncharacterized protein (TIGR03435 family)
LTKHLAALVLPAVLVVQGQSDSRPANKSPEFEVASIKPMKAGTQGFFIRMEPGGRFYATGVTMKFLLEEAFQVKDSQVFGAPAWLDSDRFDIDAKPDEDTSAAFDKLPPDQRRQELNQMLQGLLADRLKLVLNHDTKDLPVYALVVAKGGPKFQESSYKPPEISPDSPPSPGGQVGPPRQGIWMQGRGDVTVTAVQMKMFADVLSRMVGRPVIDKTGLTGSYDFKLKYTPEEGQGMMMPPGAKQPGSDGAPPPADSNGPSLFTALQEQLGLKLDSQKAPVEVLVIQHVEKPSEN